MAATAGKSTRDSSECPGLTTSAGPVYLVGLVYGTECEKSATGGKRATRGKFVCLVYLVYLVYLVERTNQAKETRQTSKS